MPPATQTPFGGTAPSFTGDSADPSRQHLRRGRAGRRLQRQRRPRRRQHHLPPGPRGGVRRAAGNDIGYVKPGEWLEYTINTPKAGIYDLSVLAKTPLPGVTVTVSLGDGTALGTITLGRRACRRVELRLWPPSPSSAAAQVALGAGEQTIRLTFNGTPDSPRLPPRPALADPGGAARTRCRARRPRSAARCRQIDDDRGNAACTKLRRRRAGCCLQRPGWPAGRQQRRPYRQCGGGDHRRGRRLGAERRVAGIHHQRRAGRGAQPVVQHGARHVRREMRAASPQASRSAEPSTRPPPPRRRSPAPGPTSRTARNSWSTCRPGCRWCG